MWQILLFFDPNFTFLTLSFSFSVACHLEQARPTLHQGCRPQARGAIRHRRRTTMGEGEGINEGAAGEVAVPVAEAAAVADGAGEATGAAGEGAQVLALRRSFPRRCCLTHGST